MRLVACAFALAVSCPVLAADGEVSPGLESWSESTRARLRPIPEPPARDQWVPPGFEDLAAPQTTLVDISFGGYYLISTMVRFSPEEVVILDPQAVVDRLPDLIDPEAFAQALARPFYPNSELLCRSQFQQDCERIETDGVDLIFDRSQLHISLFIGSPLLKTRTAEQMKYLPPSDAGLSILNDTAAYYSGFAGEDLTYNVANESVIAFAENRVIARSNFTNAGRLEVDELAVRREFRGQDYQLGLFRSGAGGSAFLQNQQFIGISAESSLATRANIDFALANDLEVFLSGRSRVEIFKDGRLLQSRFYDAGNQVLDTSMLPSGSYDVDIRITDSSGRTTTEVSYFTKTARLPPTDQALYFFQAGRETQSNDSGVLPSASGRSFFRSGIRKRIAASVGAATAISVDGDSVLFESSLYKQARSLQTEIGIAYDTLDVAGLDMKLRYRLQGLNLAVSARRIWNSLGDSPDETGLSAFRKKSQIGDATAQYNSTLAFRAFKGRISLFNRYNKRDHSASQNYGIQWSADGWNLGGGNLAANAELSKNDGRIFASLSLSYRFSRDNLAGSVSSTMEAREGVDGSLQDYPRARSELRWRSDDQYYNDYELSLAGTSDTESDIEANAKVATDVGTADMSVRWIATTGKTELRGEYSSRFAATPEAFSFGGRRRAESAVLVEVDAAADLDAEFEIVVDTVKRGTVKAGETRLVALGAFKTHDIELRSTGGTFATLSKAKERRTVYPGNVLALNWEAKSVFVGIGRLLDTRGEPMPNALIKNASGLAITDEFGFFQAELDTGTQILSVQKSAATCFVDLGEYQVREQVASLGTLTCASQSL
jgi:outer membrane usher protein FimD/PapC